MQRVRSGGKANVANAGNNVVEITINTKQLTDDMAEGIRKGLEAAGIFIEGRAKAYAPVDTGLLRNSIAHALSGEQPSIGGGLKGGRHQRTYKSNPTNKHGEAVETVVGKDGKARLPNGTYAHVVQRANSVADMRVYVGTNVEYAPYVEMGHVNARTGRRVPAQPYIQPAFNNNMTAARQIIEQYLKDAAQEFKNR